METFISKKYDETMSCNINIGLYHSYGWNKVLKNGFNIEINYLYTYDAEEFICCTPLLIKKLFGFLCIGSPLRGLFTEYLGPIFNSNNSIETNILAISNQLTFLKKLNPIYIEFCLNNNFELSFDKINNLFESNKFFYQKRPSLLLDISGTENEIWDKLSSRARNMVRKARSNNITIKFNEFINDDIVTKYYEMLSKTFQKSKIKVPHSLKSYIELIKNLELNKTIFFVSAHKSGVILAISIFLVDNKRVIYHSSASTLLGYKYAASSLIQWELIRFASKSGLIQYDFGGVGISTIDKFKKSFGGEPVTHHRWIFTPKLFRSTISVIKFLSSKGLISIFK
jgi:lipid II:glycine glycyltransferase (peptidoglycan interpeptide bridge formation enzyme)